MRMDSPRDGPPPEGPVDRIFAARFLLAVAAILFVAVWLWLALPLAYVLATILILLLVAAFVPRGRSETHIDRRELDSAALRPDASMQAMLEAFPHASFLLDRSGLVRQANGRADRLFPATRAGDPFTLTFRSPDFSHAVSEAQAGRQASIEFREPGESGRVYSVALRPVGGRAPFVLVTFDDISDRFAVARMRADFVANASHELRTPLASLTGFIETLLGPARNDAAATEKFLRVMLDQARRMRRLIDDLLSLSRAEMRVHSRPTERIDLTGVARHAADALQPLAAENDVTIAVDVPKAAVEVMGDRDELLQVVQNLVENAIRYGASGKRVDLRLATRGGGRPVAAIEVQDYGPGIAAEHVPRLTERFYRVDVGTSREMKGTGLGLAIVKHILTRHAGELQVKSVPGHGATFIVAVPLTANEHQTAEEPPAN
jgi:two-component system phosphate regulon sensor histidine kinase PhoR